MRRICFVSGSRADYGLLKPLMRQVRAETALDFQLVVTGSHLSNKHGLTVEKISDDGFPVSKSIPILAEGDSSTEVAASFGIAVREIALAYEELAPDIVVLLGDRYEALAAGVAATLMRIPIAHLHGGERTSGAFDEAFRHSLTKMSHLHFVATEEYRARVMQLGEDASRIWVTGALALDGMTEESILSRTQLEVDLDINLGDLNFLVTFHPATLDVGKAKTQVFQLLGALMAFPEARIFFTLPNADPEAGDIAEEFSDFVMRNPGNAYLFASLGQERYWSLMRNCHLVIGNSSSGLIEAPTLGIPTVNIGDRQDGRLRGCSVFDARNDEMDIQNAIRKALDYSRGENVSTFTSPYGERGSSQIIVEQLLHFPLGGILKKDFVDRF